MVYEKLLHVRVTEEQHKKLHELADAYDKTTADLIRQTVDLLTSKDYIVIPLNARERMFIEGVADTCGVEPSEAVRMVLLSYHTLMSKELWKLVKPIDQILDEARSGDEKECPRKNGWRNGCGK